LESISFVGFDSVRISFWAKKVVAFISIEGFDNRDGPIDDAELYDVLFAFIHDAGENGEWVASHLAWSTAKGKFEILFILQGERF